MERGIVLQIIGPRLLSHSVAALLSSYSEFVIAVEEHAAVAPYGSRSLPSVLLVIACGASSMLAETLGRADYTPSPPRAVLLDGREERLREASARGVSVFLSMEDEPDMLCQGIRAAAQSQAFCSPLLTACLIHSLKTQCLIRERESGAYGPELSAREREVAQLAAEGLSNQEIASRLFVGVSTIKAHLREVYRKVGVQRRSQLHGCEALATNGAELH